MISVSATALIIEGYALTGAAASPSPVEIRLRATAGGSLGAAVDPPMDRARVPVALKAAVRERAGERCEYCRVPEIGNFADPDREDVRRRMFQAGRYPG